MGKLLSAVFGSILVLVIVGLGPAEFYYEHHFTGYHFAGIPFVHWFAFTIKPGLGVRYAALEAQDAAAKAKAVQVAHTQAAITAAASAHESAAQTIIRTRTITLTREVHDVLTPDTDRRFPLPNGLVRLYDASALGLDLSAVPNAPGQSDGDASPIAASSAGTVFVANNGGHRSCIEQVGALQHWILDEAAAAK